VAGSVSLTQFQGGWSSALIQPMTFASSTVVAGDYVVGQLLNFAQASSSWTVNVYGAVGVATVMSNVVPQFAGSTVGVLSSGGLSAASAFTSSAGATGGSKNNLSTYTVSIPTAATTTLEAYSAPPSGITVLSTGGLQAGSFLTASNSVGVVTSAALAFTPGTATFTTLPNFAYIGTGGTPLPAYVGAFIAGIMSTGAIPASIAITNSTAVIYSGSFAFQQPWFALIGS